MRRRGFSLLEVLLALAVLLGSLVVLAELASIGRQHVRDAEDFTTAERLCQTKVNEILAGIEDPIDVEYAEIVDEPGWLYSIETELLEPPGLLAVYVTVTEDVPEDVRAREFTIARWMRDPGGRSTFEEPAAEGPVSEKSAFSNSAAGEGP